MRHALSLRFPSGSSSSMRTCTNETNLNHCPRNQHEDRDRSSTDPRRISRPALRCSRNRYVFQRTKGEMDEREGRHYSVRKRGLPGQANKGGRDLLRSLCLGQEREAARNGCRSDRRQARERGGQRMNLQTLGKSNTRQSVPVWDLFVRVFHWSVVFAFTGAYVLSDDGGALHHAFGYVVLGLVAARIAWGFTG